MWENFLSMNIFKRVIKKDEKIWENNPIAQLLLFVPAGMVSRILMIPMVIFMLPSLLLGKNIQRIWLRFLLIVQHTISLSFWYFVSDYIFPDLINLPYYMEIPLCLFLVYFNFKTTITTLTNETISEYGI
tara:strand:+ start:50 stop:439 length:390 start_codon:yes stop_codon:yes gene_type:complete